MRGCERRRQAPKFPAQLSTFVLVLAYKTQLCTARDAKVSELHNYDFFCAPLPPTGSVEHVLGLDVVVQHALRMHVNERQSELMDDANQPSSGRPAVTVRVQSAALECLLKVVPTNVLH